MPRSLFTAEDRMTVPEFLYARFGKREPTPEEAGAWQLAEIRHFLNSTHYAVTNYFLTKDELTNELVSMQPFTGQAILSVCYNAQLQAGYPRHIIEYKPRQCGWTSFVLGHACHNVLKPNRGSLVLVDDEDVADKISTKIGTMINGLPAWMQPMRRIQNMSQFWFENPNPKERIFNPGLNSTLQVGIPTSFRGDTPPFVVISEFAFMNDERKALVSEGLIPAMHMTEHVSLFIDTTPNGYDEYYEPMIKEAMEDNPKWTKRLMTARNLTAEQVLDGILGVPDNLDRPVPAISFWHHHEGYSTRDCNPRAELPRMNKARRDELHDTLGKMTKYGGDEESHLKKYWNLDDGQLYWRRRKIDSYKMPTQQLKLITFRQEFPSDIDSGFQSYENSPFDMECLDTFRRQIREPIARGIFRKNGDGVLGIDTTFHSDWQELRVYAGYDPRYRYSLGIDTNIAYESLEADATVGCILRWPDRFVCAVYEARVPEFVMLEQLNALWQFYGHPYYAPETKGIGYALVRKMIDMGMTNCYWWHRLDKAYSEPTDFPGWDTSERTRPLMDEFIVRMMCWRNPETQLPAPQAIVPDRKMNNELRALRRTATGSLKAPSGHDDHADAFAIAGCIQEDKWGGFAAYINEPDSEGRKQEEFEKLFAQASATAKYAGPRPSGSSRNNPSLANI